MKINVLLILIILAGCSKFIKTMEGDDYHQQISKENGSENFSIIFSHNINGETHPCGCRHFPLGGLAQIAGIMHEAKSKAPLLYLDTGDTFFPSTVLPDSMKESLMFIANQLVDSLSKLGLKYYTPGDQDFAAGVKFLEELSNKAKFDFVVSNFQPKVKIKHKKYVSLKVGDHKIFIIGVVDPSVFPGTHKQLFRNPEMALKETLKEVENKADDDDMVILMSHAGVDKDKIFAKKFPRLNWIIGAHSQSFYRSPKEVGETGIVQVLSRNHYLGKINIPFSFKNRGSYEVIEVRDDQKDKLKDNPFISFLEDHKKELKKIQDREQKSMALNFNANQKIKTAISCMECHKDQTKFWQGTAHSLAFETLRRENEDSNPKCIGCHSVGFQKQNGFMVKDHLILRNKKPIQDKEKYWKAITGLFNKHKKESIRKMPIVTRRKIAQAWMSHDEKNKISHNFANVQCLNCHDKDPNHPFDIGDSENKPSMKSKCLSCHTRDQAPSWYKKDKKGLAGDLDEKVYKQKLKLVSCPEFKEI